MKMLHFPQLLVKINKNARKLLITRPVAPDAGFIAYISRI